MATTAPKTITVGELGQNPTAMLDDVERGHDLPDHAPWSRGGQSGPPGARAAPGPAQEARRRQNQFPATDRADRWPRVLRRDGIPVRGRDEIIDHLGIVTFRLGQSQNRGTEPSMPTPLRSEQSQRNHRYPVWPTVGSGAGVEDHGIKQPIADRIPQPTQVPDVGVGYRSGKLDLNRQHPTVGSNDDQIHLVVTVSRAKVAHPGFSGLRGHANAQRRKGLEQATQHRALLGTKRTSLTIQKRLRGQPE